MGCCVVFYAEIVIGVLFEVFLAVDDSTPARMESKTATRTGGRCIRDVAEA